MLLCREVVFTLWTFVIVGLLANLPCADLAFQQETQQIMHIQGTNGTWAPPTVKQDTHTKCPLKTRQEIFTIQSKNIGRGDKKPILGLRPQECRKQHIGHHYITNIFFALQRCSRTLLTLLKMHNFSPRHPKRWKFSEMQFKALQLLICHPFT